MNPHCKIGRVRMKGRPEIRVVCGSRADNFLHDLLRHNVGTIIGYEPDMAGYVVVAWNESGGFSRAVRSRADFPVGVTMLPSFVADILRRDTMEDVVREVIEPA